jgi:hypothetical protein
MRPLYKEDILLCDNLIGKLASSVSSVQNHRNVHPTGPFPGKLSARIALMKSEK